MAKRELNVLTLDLSVIGEDKIHVEMLVDGRRIAGSEDDETAIAWGLLPSIDHDGYYYVLTCECGDPGCAGYMDPIHITHQGGLIDWQGEYPEADFTFDGEAYEAEIRRVIQEGHRVFRERNMLTRLVGENYGDIKLFADPGNWSFDGVRFRQDQERLGEQVKRRELWRNDPDDYRRQYPRKVSPLSHLGCVLKIPVAVLMIPLWIVLMIGYFVLRAIDRRAERSRRQSAS